MFDFLILAHQVPEDWRAQAEVFDEIFLVFLVIGTLVGVVVVGYTLFHAYRGRDTGESDEKFDPPVVGELPVGQEGGKSKKLFFSFGLSAIIVISLVVYSYGLLLYVEQGPSNEVADTGEETAEMEVEVVGVQFAWQFHYPNGKETFNELRVPEGAMIRLSVTSNDVWHNFGVPELRIKADSIPGQYSHTWFLAEETGSYTIRCYELCGSGHSEMNGEIIVMETEEFYEWYESGGNETNASDSQGGEMTETESGDTHNVGTYDRGVGSAGVAA